MFLHLFEHFYKDDNRIRSLLCSQNNVLFLTFFKQGLIKLLEGCNAEAMWLDEAGNRFYSPGFEKLIRT